MCPLHLATQATLKQQQLQFWGRCSLIDGTAVLFQRSRRVKSYYFSALGAVATSVVPCPKGHQGGLVDHNQLRRTRMHSSRVWCQCGFAITLQLLCRQLTIYALAMTQLSFPCGENKILAQLPSSPGLLMWQLECLEYRYGPCFWCGTCTSPSMNWTPDLFTWSWNLLVICD